MYACFRVLWINLIITSESFLLSNSEGGDSSVVQPTLILKLEGQIYTKQTNWEKLQGVTNSRDTRLDMRCRINQNTL